jgi:ketosteroid isomerase-like protein
VAWEIAAGSTKVKTEPIRFVSSDSHDLAYEYSKYNLEYTTAKNSKHIQFDGGLLRVWQKQDGQWKEAAVFMHPYDDDE